MIGRTIGTYKITGTIGSGGMGEVFVGEDLMLERQVAIKQLRPELASRPDVVERFRSEAVLLAKLHHTNIATVYAFLQEGANFFLVMEYIRGWSLQQVLKIQGALAPAVVVGLFQQALDGIGIAHQRHIIHRDLKPANVMLTDGGVIKVMDFGLARVIGSAHLTRTGRLVGTLEYISPEQIRGEETDARSDIYSLGVVLYELVTGRLPFMSDSEYALVRAQVEAPPPSPRLVTPVVSSELEQIILRALAKIPAGRFQSTEEFSLALARCIPKTNTQGALSAFLIALKANALIQAESATIDSWETRQTAQPAAASAQIEATRHAEAIYDGATERLSSRRPQAWKTYVTPIFMVAFSVAVVGFLFFVGGSDPPSEPTLSPGLSTPVEWQSDDNRATPLKSESPDELAITGTGTTPRLTGQIGESNIPVNAPDTSPLEPVGSQVEKWSAPPQAPGSALSEAEPHPLEAVQPQPVAIQPLKESVVKEDTAKAPSSSGGLSVSPPLAFPLLEDRPDTKEGRQDAPPQRTENAKRKPRKSSAPKIPPETRQEETKGSGEWYIKK